MFFGSLTIPENIEYSELMFEIKNAVQQRTELKNNKGFSA